MEWKFQKISGDYFPRQFEYHPQDPSKFIFGTVFGEACSVDLSTHQIRSLGFKGKNQRDAILGLRWMKKDLSHLFIVGTSEGQLSCVDSITGVTQHSFLDFQKLTSVHLSCDNASMLISGYQRAAHIYDVATGQVLQKYEDIHTDHINISRFANHSPTIFSTSSFDRTIKTWDTRCSTTSAPIYTVQANSGVVMINFSNDDSFILASALDNEINQYHFVDGRLHLSYDLPSTGLSGNFTRAYYSSSGKYVITGACEERNVKFLCSYTGEYLSSIDMYPGKREKSLYIQSLRGNPSQDNAFCVLVNYRDVADRELLLVNGSSIVTDKDSDQRDLSISGTESEKQSPMAESISSPRREQQSPLSLSSSALVKDLFPLRMKAHYGSIESSLTSSCTSSAEANDMIRLTHSQYRQSLSLRCVGNVATTVSHSLSSFEMDMDMLIHQSFGTASHQLHSFIALARCPILFELYSQQRKHNNNSIIYNEIDVASLISEDEWPLLPLVIDYCYVGIDALELATLRAYALVNIFERLPRSEWVNAKNELMTLVSERIAANESTSDRNENSTNTLKRSRSRQERHIMDDEDKSAIDLDQPTSSVDELVSLCVDESVWRLSSLLNESLCNVFFALYTVGIAFSLSNLSDRCCELLGDHLLPSNTFRIAHWAREKKIVSLQEKTTLAIIRFGKLMSSQPMVELKTTSSLLDVILDPEVTSAEIETLRAEVLPLWKHSVPRVCTRAHLQTELGPLASTTLQFEETPQKLVNGYPVLSVLPKLFSHASCCLLDRYLLFIGGLRTDRWPPLSRVLVYDVKDDLFFHLNCGGTRVPTMANGCTAMALSKRQATKCVLLGGRNKQGDCCESKASVTTNVIWNSLHKSKINGLHPKAFVANFSVISDASSPKEMGASVYEFDLLTCCWQRFTVSLNIELSDPKMNPTLARFESRYPSNDSMVRLQDALMHRFGAAHGLLYLEDVPYRCAHCLFTKSSNQCACATAAQPLTNDTVPSPTSMCCYAIQFGGYCVERQEFKNDLHVLKCSRVNGCSVYSWQQVYTLGDVPAARYSHAMAVIPFDASQIDQDYTRIVICGGISIGDQSPLCVLRIAQASLRTDRDLIWESVRVIGISPLTRHKHTLTYVPGANVSVMVGGCLNRSRTPSVQPNDIWTLAVKYDNLRSVCGMWTRVLHGDDLVVPSPRSFHSTNAVMLNQGQIFIFGGVADQNELNPNVQQHEERFVESIMYSAVFPRDGDPQWVPLSSGVIVEDRESSHATTVCSLSADLSRLCWTQSTEHHLGSGSGGVDWHAKVEQALNSDPSLNAFLPNFRLRIPVDEIPSSSTLDDRPLQSAVSYQDILSYESLLRSRCSLFESMRNSQMLESQSTTITLSPTNNMNMFLQLVIFMLSQSFSTSSLQETVGLLELANEYGMNMLKLKCEGQLLQMISPDTVCELLSFAEWWSLDLLRSACYKQLLQCSNLDALLTALAKDSESSSSTILENGEKEEKDTLIYGDQSSSVTVDVREFCALSPEIKSAFVDFVETKMHIGHWVVLQRRNLV